MTTIQPPASQLASQPRDGEKAVVTLLNHLVQTAPPPPAYVAGRVEDAVPAYMKCGCFGEAEERSLAQKLKIKEERKEMMNNLKSTLRKVLGTSQGEAVQGEPLKKKINLAKKDAQKALKDAKKAEKVARKAEAKSRKIEAEVSKAVSIIDSARYRTDKALKITAIAGRTHKSAVRAVSKAVDEGKGVKEAARIALEEATVIKEQSGVCDHRI